MRKELSSGKCPLLQRLLAVGLSVSIMNCGVEREGLRVVTFKTDDGGSIDAALFEAGRRRAAVFAHGAVFDKESWYPVAARLQQVGVTSLCIDFRGYGESKGGPSEDKYLDVLGAVKYLNGQGCAHIALVGGSMGGAAVLEALAHADNPSVDKVVVLAAAGPSMESAAVGKLFVVAQQDPILSRVKSCFDASSEPKQLKAFPGGAHAQHLFSTEHAQELTNTIVAFLTE